MERQIEKIILETYARYQRSGHHKSGFYDITLSVISWLVLSQLEQKRMSDRPIAANLLFLSGTNGTIHKQNIADTLKNWEEYKGPPWKNLLQLDPSLIDRLPNTEWQFILNSWERLFAVVNLDARLFAEEVFTQIERTIIAEQNDELMHITPKEVANLMAFYLKGNEGGTLYDPFTRTGNLLNEALLKLPSIKSVFGFSTISQGWKLANLRLLFNSEGLNIAIQKKMSYESETGKFDFIISNPPYGQQMIDDLELSSTTDEWSDLLRKSNRLEIYYLCHILSHLTNKGKASILLPSIFLSGNLVIKELFKRLLSRNVLDAVVALPGNLFAYTSIPTVMICINKSRKIEGRILLADASKEVIRNGRLNILKTEKIETWFESLESQSPKSDATLLVTADDIARHGYSLYVAAYRQEKTLSKRREPSAKLKNEYEELENRIVLARTELANFLTKSVD